MFEGDSGSQKLPIFTHFGLFWSVDDVQWVKGKKGRGGLLGRERTRLDRRGRPSKEEKDNSKDYGDFVGLYCLYRDSRLVYVGEAGLGNNSRLFNRLKQHLDDHLADQWEEFSWFGRPASEIMAKANVKDAFAQLEALLISVTNPGSNKQNGTYVGATQVFQVPGENAEGDMDTKLARLMTKLEIIEAKLTPPPPPKLRGRPRKASADD